MRFKRQQNDSQIPEVNLVPMMDVLMTVLTFFIIMSMTLTGQKLGNISLPKVGTGTETITTEETQANSLIIGINNQGEVFLKNQPISEENLLEQVQTYLTKNPAGNVVVKADRQLTYQQIIKLLKKLQAVGGERVSLAIERT